MGRNLTNLPISASFQYLLQKSGSEVNDGLGADVDYLNISSSYAYTASVADTATSASHAVNADSALTATSASHAVNSDTAISASFATTASYAENAGASTLQEVLDNSNVATGVDIILTGSYQRASGSFSGTVIDNITDTYTGTEKIQHVITLTQAEYNALTPAADTFYVITDAAATLITASVSDATITFTKDDATTFPIEINNVSSSISASHALQADSALSADTATSASYALTASFLEGGVDPFPYTGSAEITGSLGVTGSINIVGSLISGQGNNTATPGNISVAIGGNNNNAGALRSVVAGGESNTVTAGLSNGIFAGTGNSVSNRKSVVVGGQNHTISHERSVILGGSGLSSTKNDEVVVPSLVATALTASGLIYPSADGSNGDVLTTDGAGNLTLQPAAGGAAFPYTGSAEITGSLGVTGSIEGIGNVVIGNSNNSATGNYHAIVGGSGNTINASNYAGIFGGEGHSLTGANHNVILGGWNNTNNADNRGTILGGSNLTLTNGNVNGIGFGSYGTVEGGQGNFILGNWGTYLYDAQNDAQLASMILNSPYSKLRGSASGTTKGYNKQSSIISSEYSEILGDSGAETRFSGILYSSQSLIPAGTENSVIIARNAFTASADNTVYTPNLDVSGSLLVNGSPVGAAFPYTGSAEITGSLTVTGPVNIDGTSLHLNSVATSTPGADEAVIDVASASPTLGSGARVAGAFAASRPTIGSGVNQGAIIAADLSSIGGTRNGVFGGYDNDIANVNNAYIYGGAFNDITGAGNGLIIVGCNTGLISGGSYSTIVGGNTNTISGGNYNAIVGGDSATASHDRSVVLGGESLSTSKADEVVVEHLTVSGSAVGEVNSLTITSNTASMDCSLGNMFTLTINQQSDVHLDATNIQAGQTINLEVLHDATNSGSLSYAPEFQFPGGTAPTITAAASSNDVLTFVAFKNTVLYGTSLLNFS